MANHAHSTLTPLLSLAGALPPLLLTVSSRQPGPVTAAIRAMRREGPPLPPEWLADLAAGRAALQNLRKRIANRVEYDLAILDALDGDEDREGDFATTERAWDGTLYVLGRTADDEPSLCGVGHHVLGGNQEGLPQIGGNCGGSAHDLEAEDEHSADDDAGERTLGWCNNVGQVELGPNTDDGDATALERHGAGFVCSGHEDDEDTQDAEGVTDDNGIADMDGALDVYRARSWSVIA